MNWQSAGVCVWLALVIVLGGCIHLLSPPANMPSHPGGTCNSNLKPIHPALFIRGGGRFYSVEAMIAMTRDVEPRQFPINLIEHALYAKLWAVDATNVSNTMSPHELMVLKNVTHAQHTKRVEEANLSYPLLVVDVRSRPAHLDNQRDYWHFIPQRYRTDDTGDPIYDLVDGLHRLAKAKFILRRETVLAKVIDWSLVEKARYYL